METTYYASVREIESNKYREVLREFEEKQLEIHKKQEAAIAEIYEKIPRIREIDCEISKISLAKAREKLENSNCDLTQYKKQIASLSLKKVSLMEDAGYPSDYLEAHYTCKKCKDTGFVDGKPCSCFKQELYNKLYNQNNIYVALNSENFDNFNYSLYSDERDPLQELTPLQNIKKVVKTCNEFIDNFDESKESLLIFGEVGVGKTFLTSCIANELIKRSHSVVYISAVKLFEMLSDTRSFSRDYETQLSNLSKKHLFDSELLIIDDLGTELTNSYTASHLFNCINERMLTGKPTIISTNLNLPDIQRRYSDRIFSRIISSYKLLKIYGDDIRNIKRTRSLMED